MAGTAESRKFGRAEDVSGSAIVDIASEAIFRARRPSAVSESITTLMSITQWGQSAADCLAIVGPQEPASREAQRIANWANRRCRIEVFSDRMAPDEETGKRTSRTDIGRLATLVRSGKIRRILLATPAREHQRIASVMKQLEGMNVDVDFVLEGFSTYSCFGFGMTEDVCIARILRRPLTSTQALIKSIIDRIAALLLIVLIAPCLLCIALLVKLTSRGPILFRQQRFGLNNEVFEVFKFRTLYHRHTGPNAQQPVTQHDQRVTPIGKYLRALSLDERPQLLNVLRETCPWSGPGHCRLVSRSRVSVSGFQSNHGRVQDLVENNRFEGNSINLVQGTTKRFRIGSEYLDLEQAQQRGQEKRSRAEFAPSGTPHSFDMKCPPNVGRREVRK